MKRLVALLLAITLAMPAGAAIVEGEQVMYVGGSVADMKQGAMGRLDVTDEKEFVFASATGKLAIPYHDIRSFTYSRKLARRTGVLAAAVVVLIKRRQRCLPTSFRPCASSADGTPPSHGRCEPAGRRRPAPGGSKSCPRSPGTARAP